jgi:hypothetical protein
MARRESDREDLIREATALVERIELAPRTKNQWAASSTNTSYIDTQSIVVGFRSNGAASFYFDHDPVYQFNAARELRRAYCGGLLYKASRGGLVSLTRVRQAREVQLVSHELNDVETSVFLRRMASSLCELTEKIGTGEYVIAAQVPPGAGVLGRVVEWLNTYPGPTIAHSPRA